MTVFADASALTAMIAGEPGCDALADRLSDAPLRLVSAIAVWETVAALRRSHGIAIAAADAAMRDLIAQANLTYVAIGAREAELAIQAYASFGRGRHPAALNMGDCFAYACARANRAALLFIGDDFGKTDIARAL